MEINENLIVKGDIQLFDNDFAFIFTKVGGNTKIQAVPEPGPRKLGFYVADGSGGSNEVMRLTEDGRLAIGGTTANELVQVHGNFSMGDEDNAVIFGLNTKIKTESSASRRDLVFYGGATGMHETMRLTDEGYLIVPESVEAGVFKCQGLDGKSTEFDTVDGKHITVTGGIITGFI